MGSRPFATLWLPRIVLIAGAALFVVSWALPVAQGSCSLSEGLPGWEALAIASTPLWQRDPAVTGPWWSQALPVASAATNLVMAAALALSLRRHGHDRAVGIAVIAAFLVNAQWMVWSFNPESVVQVRVGYFAWWLSFLVVGCGLLLIRRDN